MVGEEVLITKLLYQKNGNYSGKCKESSDLKRGTYYQRY